MAAELDDDAAPPQRVQPQPERRLHALSRLMLMGAAVGCALGIVMMLTLVGEAQRSLASVVGFLGVGVAALAARRAGVQRMPAALTAVLMGLCLVITYNSLALGYGLAAPGLATNGLVICMVTAAVGWRAGVLLTAWDAVLVLLVPLLQQELDLSLPLAPPGSVAVPLGLQLATQLMAVGFGLVSGVLVSRLLSQGMLASEEREQRFRRLLALSVDGYWEIDERYRLKAAADRSGDVVPLLPGRGLDAVPWELPQWQCDADTQDVMLADLEGRQPFRDLMVRWGRSDGSQLSLLVSGEPRFDDRGVFTGYWGVLRDVTAEEQAQVALQATETRYRELFARIPTPLVLHRGGRVLDANAAALALFEQPALGALTAADLLSFYEAGDSRERERQRMQLLHGQPMGTALPPADFRLVLPGRRIVVRATSVRLDADGGPATLCIYADETERRAAEEALRRSEAMLSTLVATSPDLITLTEIASGRYVMVNRAFERVSGWTAAEAIGRTSHELGIWGSAQAREAFVQRMQQDGSVADWPQDFVNKFGAVYSMVVSAARFEMEGGQYMVINARDVSEKERTRLEREAILQGASIGIAVTRKRRFVLVNRHFEQMFGWGPGELNGQSTMTVWHSPADRAESGTVMGEALMRGELVDMERQARRKDGSAFTARVRGRPVDPRTPIEGGLVWIVEDVTQRREFEQALARARDEAEAASRAKSAFLANTSHELRTPLNGLIGLSRLARDENLDGERRRQYLEQIELSAQSLAGIISDILDLSRIEAGKMPIEVQVFELGNELRTLQRTYGALAELRGLRLSLELGAGLLPRVRGDALRLRQVLSNFLVNAIKFTERGEVQLRAWRLDGARADFVRLEVQDSGRGIPAETLPRLFKPFTQADDSTTRRYGGTGLGLSICHELAQLMGGSVGARSSEGLGSVFWAELPLPEVAAAEAQPETAPEPVAPVGSPPPALLPPGTRQLPGARVLLAEDNAVNMMIAVAMLERWGVTVTQAGDGREAVAAVQRAAARGEPFHAVLMDVQMPVMSGHEATRTLRRAEQARGARPLPIIALTAAALVSERDEALQSGMNDFLTKPIDAEKLFATLQRWCTQPAGD